MPIFLITDSVGQLVVEAKSKQAALLHMSRAVKCEVIGARMLADLVMKGVNVERAGKEAEATEAALRG